MWVPQILLYGGSTIYSAKQYWHITNGRRQMNLQYICYNMRRKWDLLHAKDTNRKAKSQSKFHKLSEHIP